MSVLSVQKYFSGRSASYSDGTNDYAETWLVITDNVQDGGSLVLSDARLPRRGQSYRSGNDRDMASFCSGLSATQDDGNPKLWKVEVTYSTDGADSSSPSSGGSSGGSGGQELLDTRPRITFSSAQYQKVIDRDVKGRASRSSAMEVFDPPVMAERSRPVLTIDLNTFQFDRSLQRYVDAINSDTWLGNKPFSARCTALTQTEQKIGNRIYNAVHMEFQMNFTNAPPRTVPVDTHGGWIYYQLDQGTIELDANGKPKRMIANDGPPETTPQLLDGKGRRLVPKGERLDPDKVKPVYIPLHIYEELPFNQLISL